MAYSADKQNHMEMGTKISFKRKSAWSTFA